jgi:hypothetical protein
MDRKRRDKKEALQKRSKATAILKKAIPTCEIPKIITDETGTHHKKNQRNNRKQNKLPRNSNFQ